MQLARILKLVSLAIIMPDDVAEEKVKALLAMGADVERVRPASIVDKRQFVVRLTNFAHSTNLTPPGQNLARQRAAHFGEDSVASHSAVLRDSTSVVVTTTAGDIIAPGHGVITAQDEAELRGKPRGFFADQFEVYFFELASLRNSHLNDRTAAITWPTSMARALKFGDRPAGVWMRSCLGQVRRPVLGD